MAEHDLIWLEVPERRGATDRVSLADVGEIVRHKTTAHCAGALVVVVEDLGGGHRHVITHDAALGASDHFVGDRESGWQGVVRKEWNPDGYWDIWLRE